MKIIVGAGAAGMMAAGTAASLGKDVILIEKNDELGKKLKITGKGRCNLTCACDKDEFFKNIPTNPSFLYSAFSQFSNYDTISFFENLGVKTKVERGMRVFPESDKAKDVVDALKKYVFSNNAKVIKGEVKQLLFDDGKVIGVKLSGGEKIYGDGVLIATGGASYPKTGSTGDGYELAKSAGHTIVPIKPSLVPLESKDGFIPKIMGLSLKNVEISVLLNDKKIYTDFGEMLFTHFGLSGPVILSASAHMREEGHYYISIDLKPALDFETLDKRILRDFSEFSSRDFINSLEKLLPRKLIPVVVELSQIDPRKKVHQITKKERENLVRLIKDFRVNISKKRPVSEAIITSGGVSTREIVPKTMESKLKKGLFFAGEVIDVDAYTGGFNLQIAFSTGYVAGLNI